MFDPCEALVDLYPKLPSFCMQKVPHPSEAQSNTVNQFDCCSRGNSVCKCISFLVHISVQMHRIRSTRGVRGFLHQHRTEISDFDRRRNRACLGGRRRGALLSERKQNDGGSGNDIAWVLFGWAKVAIRK